MTNAAFTTVPLDVGSPILFIFTPIVALIALGLAIAAIVVIVKLIIKNSRDK